MSRNTHARLCPYWFLFFQKDLSTAEMWGGSGVWRSCQIPPAVMHDGTSPRRQTNILASLWSCFFPSLNWRKRDVSSPFQPPEDQNHLNAVQWSDTLRAVFYWWGEGEPPSIFHEEMVKRMCWWFMLLQHWLVPAGAQTLTGANLRSYSDVMVFLLVGFLQIYKAEVYWNYWRDGTWEKPLNLWEDAIREKKHDLAPLEVGGLYYRHYHCWFRFMLLRHYGVPLCVITTSDLINA